MTLLGIPIGYLVAWIIVGIAANIWSILAIDDELKTDDWPGIILTSFLGPILIPLQWWFTRRMRAMRIKECFINHKYGSHRYSYQKRRGTTIYKCQCGKKINES